MVLSRSLRSSCLLLLLLIGSCATRETKPPPLLLPPEEMVSKAINNLKGETFRFEWSISRMGGEVKGEFHGEAEGNRIRLKGEWIFGGDRESTELIGIDDTQYRLENGRWIEAPRGEETSLFSQMERVLSLRGFQLQRSEGGCNIYNFKPNLAFLDPLLQVDPVGEIWIDETLHLPTKIHAYDREGGTLSWRLFLLDFGASIRVLSPTEKRYEYVLEGEEKELSEACTVLRHRLSLLDFPNSRIDRLGRGRIRLSILSSEDPSERLREIIRTGTLEVFSAIYPNEPVYMLTPEMIEREYGEGASLGFEREDPTKPLVLLESVFSSGDLDGAEVVYDRLSEPSVRITLRGGKEEILLADLRAAGVDALAIRLDGEVVSAPKLGVVESERILEIEGNLSPLAAELLRAKIDSGALPCELTIVKSRAAR